MRSGEKKSGLGNTILAHPCLAHAYGVYIILQGACLQRASSDTKDTMAYGALTRFTRSSPSAMVLRSVRRGLMNRYGSRAGVAARVIGTAWRHRRAIGAVSKRLAMRKWRSVVLGKSFSKNKYERRLIKAPKQRVHATQQPFPTTSETIAIQTLYVAALPYPPLPINDDYALNAVRKSQSIKLHGFKICRQFQLNTDAIKDPVMVHWALVQTKDNDTQDANIITSFKRQFFRAHNDQNQKTLDFNDNTSGWSMHYNCANLSGDGDFNVLTHWRMKLEGRQGDNQTSDMWLKTIERYFKISTLMNFQNYAGEVGRSKDIPNHPIYEIMWWSPITPNGFNNTVNLQTRSSNTCYFHNKF